MHLSLFLKEKIMQDIHPQFIIDAQGNRISVVLPMEEYKALLEALDMVDDVRLYDEAKKNDDGERILFSDYLKSRKEKSNGEKEQG